MWKDHTDGCESDLELGQPPDHLRIKILPLIGQDSWSLHVSGLIFGHRLKAKTLEDAKREALEFIQVYLLKRLHLIQKAL